MSVSLHDVYMARKKISSIVKKTPLVYSPVLSGLAEKEVYLKLENLQETGSFKVRGVLNKLLSLSEDDKRRGVVASSSGNHGRALAFVSGKLGVKATVIVSEHVPSYKVEAIKSLGAEVIVAGKTQDDAMEFELKMEQEGMVRVSPFDDPFVIAGQGTIGLEILEELPDISTVIVPVSGGGLISGIAVAMRSVNKKIKVVGVSMEKGPAMYYSLKAGKPVDVEEEYSIADGLLGGIGLNNRYTFRMVQKYVDEIVLVSEKEIADAMAFMIDRHKVVAEGAGAVSVASILSGKVKLPEGKVAVVVSGGNVSLKKLWEIFEKYDSLS